MARVNGSDLISKALKQEGVTNIFALAGDALQFQRFANGSSIFHSEKDQL